MTDTSGRRWPAVLLLLAVVLAAFAPTAARSLVSLDVWTTDLAAWRIATTGSASVEGLDLPVLDGQLRHTWIVEDTSGDDVVGRSPGAVAAGIPAYWLAGGDEMSMLPGALTAALLAGLSVVLLYLSLLPRLPTRLAFGAAVAFALTTPVWSVAANGLWPHTVTILGITGMAWAASRERWWLVGLFGAITLWGRLHAALIVALLGLGVALVRRRPGIAATVGAVSGLGLVGLCVWDRWLYGTWDPMAAYRVDAFAGYAGSNGLDVVNQLGFWVSPDRGILVWTPVILVLLPALVRSWGSLPDWSRVLLVSGLGYTVAQGLLNRFSGGQIFYGYRLGLEFLACAAPALAMSVPALRRWGRRLLPVVLGVQCAAIALGALIDRNHVSVEDVWTKNALVELFRDYPVLIPAFVVVAVLATYGFTRSDQAPSA